MSKNMILMIVGFVFLTAVFKTKAAEQPTRIQCWHCSSNTTGSKGFCGVEFNEDNIPSEMKEHNLSVLRTCSSTINSEHERAVCRKTVEEINGEVVVKRYCYYTNKDDTLDYCMQEATDKNIRRTFCQDCLTDKCNGANHLFVGNYMIVTLLVLFLIKHFTC